MNNNYETKIGYFNLAVKVSLAATIFFIVFCALSYIKLGISNQMNSNDIFSFFNNSYGYTLAKLSFYKNILIATLEALPSLIIAFIFGFIFNKDLRYDSLMLCVIGYGFSLLFFLYMLVMSFVLNSSLALIIVASIFIFMPFVLGLQLLIAKHKERRLYTRY